MRANSTQISNRMFKTQRLVILVIVAMFGLLLIITSLAGHHENVINQVKTYTNKAGDSLSDLYKSLNKLPSPDLGDADLEKQAEAQEEADRLKEEAASQKQKQD